MWTLRCLSEMGVPTENLLLVYKSKVRVHLEINVPLWTFSISQNLSKKIEKVQCTAVFIILGHKAFRNYTSNLKKLKLDTLETRRDILVNRFARKIIKHPVHKKMFQLKTRTDTCTPAPIIIPKTKRKRYMNSAIPALSRIIIDKKYH